MGIVDEAIGEMGIVDEALGEGTATKKKTVSQRLMNTAKNFPGDLYDIGKGLVQVAADPLGTMEGMSSLMSGGQDVLMRSILPNAVTKKVPVLPQETMFRSGVLDPLSEIIRKSVENPSGIPGRMADIVEENPADTMLLLSMGLGTAGKLSEAAGATRTGSALMKGSEWTNPVTVAGKPISTGLKKLAYRSKVTPEMVDRMKLSQETGVPLTPADITRSPLTSTMEAQLRRSTGSMDQAYNFDQTKAKAVQKYASKIQNEIFGGAQDPMVAGQILQKESDLRYKLFQKKAGKLYDSVPVNPNAPVETRALASTAQEHLEELGKIEHPAIKNLLARLKENEKMVEVSTKTGTPGAKGEFFGEGSPLGNMEPSRVQLSSGPVMEKVPSYTWQQLRADQSQLRKMAQSTSDYNKKRIYNDLVNAINDDIVSFSNTVGDPEVKKALDAANKFYREGDTRLPGVRTWRDKQIVNIMKTNSPEDIVNKFMKARPNASDIQRLKDVAGKKGFQAVKQAWLDDILTKGEGQSFSPAKFVTTYDKYRQGGNLNVILEPAERKGLDKLYEISRIINTAEKMAGNSSESARTLINSAYHWVKHPVYMTITHIASGKVARLYFSDPSFQQLLIQGLNSSATSKNATLIASQIAKMATKPEVVDTLYLTGQKK